MSPTLKFERGVGFPHFRVVGVDEVGRGCLAGPVVAAAVILPASWDLTLKKLIRKFPQIESITDSKAMSPELRAEIAPWIRENVAAYGIGHATVEEIDTINIYHASHLAMQRATDALGEFDHILVDGNVVPPHYRDELPLFAARDPDGTPKPLAGRATAIVKGDLHCLSIACASIIAKVHRDQWMRELAIEHPGFGLEVHKGYATEMHRTALKKLGATLIHRRTFGPVREALGLDPIPMTLDQELEQELNSPFFSEFI
jgi:ribonuclease HII